MDYLRWWEGKRGRFGGAIEFVVENCWECRLNWLLLLLLRKGGRNSYTDWNNYF
jgi:hypothetical protein